MCANSTADLSKRSPRSVHAQHGFTLVELLLATILSLTIALGALHSIDFSGHFFTQQLGQNLRQSNARFALSHLKVTLQDLGRLSVGNHEVGYQDPLYCGIEKQQGIRLYDNETDAVEFPTPEILNHNVLTPDRIALFHAPDGASPLLVELQQGSTIQLAPNQRQRSRSAYRSTMEGAEPYFESSYDSEGYVRLTQTESGIYDVIPITLAQLAGGIGKINLKRPPCSRINCNAGSCIISPLHRISIGITAHPNQPERTRLVQERIRNDGSRIEGSALVLADYVVDFQIWGDYDTRGLSYEDSPNFLQPSPPIIPQDPSLKDDRGNWDPDVEEGILLERWIHRLRGLNILILARTPRPDPQFSLAPIDLSPGVASRRWFKLSEEGKEGFARVSAQVISFPTPNLYRGD